ncbi:MAG: hypothetical protein ACTSPI_10425 [Candidatus Heimdallarchaeaceae archaeon]
MNILQFIISLSTLIVIITVLYFIIVRKTERKGTFFWIFFIGAIAWVVALFLRLIPLQLLQTLMLVFLGVNITNSEELLAYATHPLVIIWGPILAGLFEEFVRYFCSSQLKDVRKDSFKGPFILGLGWTTGEILFLYLSSAIKISVDPTLQWLIDSWSIVFAGFFERLVASAFHIFMSFLVFYAIFEKEWRKKIGLWVAIFLHFVLDSIIIIWIVIVPLEGALFIWTLEGALFLFVLAVGIWVFKYWIPKQKKRLEEQKIMKLMNDD